MSDLSWVFKIVDGMSPPALKMANAANDVSAALKAVDGAANKAQASVQGMGNAMKATASDAAKLASAVSKSTADTGHYQDKLGRWHEANGKFLKGGAGAAAALGLGGTPKLAKPSVGPDVMAAVVKMWGQKTVGSGGTGPGGLGQMIQWVGKNFGGGAADQVTQLASGLGKADDALQKVGTSMGGVVAGGAMAAVAAIAAVGIAVGMVVLKLGELAAKAATAFATMVIDRGRFREDTMAQLTAMLKSESKATEVYKLATKFADTTPFRTDVVIGAFKDLLAGGFKADELEKWMGSIGDMAAVVGQDRIPDLIRSLSKLRATGKLTQEVLEPMKLDQTKLMKNAGVKSLDELSKLSREAAEDAVRKTIEESYGGALKGMGGTLSGLLSTLESVVGTTLDKAFEASKSSGAGITGFFTEVKGIVQDVLGAIGGDTGNNAVSIINRIGDAFTAVAVVVRGFLGGLLQGFNAGFGKAADGAGALTKLDLKTIAAGAGELGAALGKAVGWMVQIATVMPSMKTLSAVWTGIKIAAVGMLPFLVLVGAAMTLALSPLLIVGAIAVGAVMAIGVALYGMYRAALVVKNWAVETFGPAVSYLVGVFKPAFSKVLGDISSGASKAWDGIKTAFGPILAAVMTALQPVVAWVQANWSTISAILSGPIKIAVYAILGAFVLAGVAVLGTLAAIAAVIQAISWLAGMASQAWQGAASIGSSIMDGITGALDPGRLNAAMTSMVQSALQSAKDALGIASPSKEFAKLGAHVSTGFARGVDMKAPAAGASIGAMISPPELAASTGGAGGAGAGGQSARTGGAPTIIFQAGAIQISGNASREDVKAGILDAFEDIAAELGMRGAPA